MVAPFGRACSKPLANRPRPRCLRRAPSAAMAMRSHLFLVALVLPLVVQNFFTFQLTLVLVYAIAIIGLNLLTGFNGQFSLGHSAFYALGAYVAAMLMDKVDVPYAMTLPVRRHRLLRLRLSVRAAGASSRRRLSRARDFCSRGRDAADPQAFAARILDRRRARHRHQQARSRLSACRSTRINGSIISPCWSPS